MGWRGKQKAWAAVAGGYLCLAFAFSWPLPMVLGSALTGDPGGDTGVYVWNQWVFQHEALVERRNPLTTTQIFALSPRVDLSQHNYTAFLDLLALPLIPLVGVIAAFNLVYLITTVITALGTYLLVRRVTAASRMEAWLAGALFAWSPVLVARSTGHFSLVAAAPIPVFIVCLLEAVRSRGTRSAALAGLCMAWAAFCDVYYAIYCLMIVLAYAGFQLVEVRQHAKPARQPWVWLLDLLIVCVGGLVAGLLVGRGGSLSVLGIPLSVRGLYTPVLILTLLVVVRLAVAWRPRVQPMLSWSPRALRIAVVGILACAGPLAPVIYGLGTHMVEGGFVSPPTLWRSSPRGVDLLAWVDPNPNHVISRWLLGDKQAENPTTYVEFTASLSLVALAVIAVAMWRAGYRPRPAWTALAIGFGLCALGPFVIVSGVNSYVPTPWAAARYIPLIGAARTPTRFAVVAALGLSVLFAGALVALRERYPRARRAMVATVAVVLLVELCPAPRTVYSARMPAIYDVIAQDPRPLRVLELPTGVRDGVSSAGSFTARSQFYQTRHGKPLIGGYLSRVPPQRLAAMRRDFPMLSALITLSEGGTPDAELMARLPALGATFLDRAHIGWVVINYATASPALVDTALRTFPIREVARDGDHVLYQPLADAATPLAVQAADGTSQIHYSLRP